MHFALRLSSACRARRVHALKLDSAAPREAKRARHHLLAAVSLKKLDRSFSQAGPECVGLCDNVSCQSLSRPSDLQAPLDESQARPPSRPPPLDDNPPHTWENSTSPPRDRPSHDPWGWNQKTGGRKEKEKDPNAGRAEATKSLSSTPDAESITHFGRALPPAASLLQLRNLISPPTLSRIGPHPVGHGTLDSPTQDPIR